MIKRTRVSDISGTEAKETEFVTLVVRSHKAIDQPKSLDVLPSEIAGLKEATDLVICEIKDHGQYRQMIVALADFRKLVPDDVVKRAQGTRGRRMNWSPHDY